MKCTRIESDLLGERCIPADSYLGIQTVRGLENFPITGIPISHFPEFITALAFTKKAAAQANSELGELDRRLADAICNACDDIINGKLAEEFSCDVLQGGGGTTANMNANEVIANRALEILGYEKGRYDILHPNTHVNMGQSTNDVYPTALRIALILKINTLLAGMDRLRSAMSRKGEEFTDVVKLGRTELQDAVPMTLGQEFFAYALFVEKDMHQLSTAQELIQEINLGATAIGTGINCHPDYPPLAAAKLREISGVDVYTAPDLIEATQDCGDYVQLSGILKRIAVKLSKICHDLRLLSSGPRGGLNEINLPKVQPGSSIMPGKVNPVIPDMAIQVCYQVIGSDVTVTMAAGAGQLELNAFEPVIAYNLFQSISILGKACVILAEKCIDGITGNREVCEAIVNRSISLATALNPHIGYARASEVAQRAYETGRSVREVVLEYGLIGEKELNDILSPQNMMGPKKFQSSASPREQVNV